MAKKVIATLQGEQTKRHTLLIKFVKNKKGFYSTEESIVKTDEYKASQKI